MYNPAFHSSFFILHFAKNQLLQRETLALTAPKTMFHRLKHNLSHDETRSFAQRNLTFGKFIFCKPPVYRWRIRVTNCHSTLCEKTQKMAFFRPSDSFVRADALNLGSKFEYYLTNSHYAECAFS